MSMAAGPFLLICRLNYLRSQKVVVQGSATYPLRMICLGIAPTQNNVRIYNLSVSCIHGPLNWE